MTDNIYNHDYILSYEKIVQELHDLVTDPIYQSKITKKDPIGYTSFGYPMDYYTIGTGNYHVLLLGATHGSELITVYFIREWITSLLKDEAIYQEYSKRFTFHILPILNVEGYIISSSNVLANFESFSKGNRFEIEKKSSRYLNAYNIDDAMAKQNVCCPKYYKKVLKSSLSYIPDTKLIKSIASILACCHLQEDVLPIWSANGLGYDPNSNSIHKLKEMKLLRRMQRYAALRYNDITVCEPSPISYPGQKPLDPHCPENVCLFHFINSLYSSHLKQKENRLLAIFSYHATGGEIYGYPNEEYATKKQMQLHIQAMQTYASMTGYTPINEKLKYGVMDFYRIALDQVATLTIELSKKNANPIGPFSNLSDMLEEIKDNKKALLQTIDMLSSNMNS